ncbi:AI-2E family transporter [Puniceicoccaceae bacterium K14]|nr:AI-2E family transporter [Puniceicoccaceae bacterium K14]
MTNSTPLGSSPLFKSFLWLAITVISFYILNIGKDLILPFVLAVFIWYLINVVSFAITKIKIKGKSLPASLRYIWSGILIIGLLGLLFSFITQNVNDVIQTAPSYQEKVIPLVDKAYELLPFEQPPSLRDFVNQFDFSGMVGSLAGALTSLAGNAGIISIYVMFLLLEQRSFSPKLRAMSKGTIREQELLELISQIDKDTRTYIGIKTFSSILTGLLSYAIMAIVGLDFAAFWGMLIFFFNFIPTVGSILATLFPSLLALVAFDTPLPIIAVIGGVAACQVLVGNFIEPKLMGNSLNLSPLVILLSLSLWGAVWGVTGMFLCVPITVIGMIICSHFPQTRPIAILLSSNGRLKSAKRS